jgi:hypothetical protein
MPIGLMPDQCVWVELNTDLHLPEDRRPAYRCKFPTVKQTIEIERLIKAARAAQDKGEQAAAAALLKQAVGTVVVGHRNIPGDFSADMLDEILTPGELWQLAYAVLRETALEEQRLGESNWQSRRASAGSATAPAANA